MRKTQKKAVLIVFIVICVFLAGGLIYRNNKNNNYPYVFYHDDYYYITKEKTDKENLGEEVAEVRRLVKRSADNKDGDSNDLEIGSKVYRTIDQPSDPPLSLIVQKEGLYYVARIMFDENSEQNGYFKR